MSVKLLVIVIIDSMRYPSTYRLDDITTGLQDIHWAERSPHWAERSVGICFVAKCIQYKV